jgi:hypothetical protein
MNGSMRLLDVPDEQVRMNPDAVGVTVDPDDVRPLHAVLIGVRQRERAHTGTGALRDDERPQPLAVGVAGQGDGVRQILRVGAVTVEERVVQQPVAEHQLRRGFQRARVAEHHGFQQMLRRAVLQTPMPDAVVRVQRRGHQRGGGVEVRGGNTGEHRIVVPLPRDRRDRRRLAPHAVPQFAVVDVAEAGEPAHATTRSR